MGIFGKKNVNNGDSILLNKLFDLALELDRDTGTWSELPDDISPESKNEVITARKMIFEYMRQLKEAGYYSNGAVKKFAKEQHPWIDKNNLVKLIGLNQFL